MARDKQFDLEFGLEDSGFQGFGGRDTSLAELSGMFKPIDYITQRQNMLDMGKRDMLEAAGAGEGVLGNLARQTEMSTGFQGMDMQTGDKQLSEFSKDFAKKYYHSKVDKDKYSSYTDWVNTSALMQNIEGKGLSVKMEEEKGKPLAYLDYGDKSINMKMFQDAANLRDEDFQDKYGLAKKEFKNNPEFDFAQQLVGHIQGVKKYYKRNIFDKPFFKDYTYDKEKGLEKNPNKEKQDKAILDYLEKLENKKKAQIENEYPPIGSLRQFKE